MEEDNPSTKKYQEFWNRVDENLSEGSYSGYKMAIVETEKILLMVLSDKNFPGKDIEERINNAKIVLQNPEKLNYSRSMYKKIIQEPGFDVSENDTKEILTGYYNSITNIIKTQKKDISKKERLGLFLQRYFRNFPKKAKKIIILITLSFLLIFILTDTSTGIAITQAITDFTRFLFYTVLFNILKILSVAVIIIGLLYFWQNRKNK
ncbi:MAG: hypothetical protein KAS01_01845 [Candidatus Pacebacteria bacterium]|nr:hypothetical protein [Candidatus Paceibacterota bacterium]